MKILLPLLFLLSLGTASGQTEAKVAKKSDTVKMNTGFLLGFWKDDSSTIKIEFRLDHNELALTHPDISYYTFHFYNTDSLPFNGVSMTWPPHNCRVRKLDENRLEIQYTLFMIPPRLATFKRIDPPGLQPVAW